MSQILIKYATRGRRKLFFDTIKNIYETSSSHNEIIIAVTYDEDDIETWEALEKEIFSFDVESKKSNIKIFRIPGRSHSKIHAINRGMYTCTLNFPNWDLLINMSDDMKFVVHDWDIIMIDQIKTIWPDTTDFFAHFNDGYVGDKLPTMTIMGREYYERFFYIYPPCYKSFSCDAEAMFVAQMLGCWHYFPDVLFKHEHPANTSHANYDRTYEEASKHGDDDTRVYFERMKKLFYVNNPVVIPELMKPHL